MSDARLPINHGDTGKVSRDKINDSFNDLVITVAGYRPHIESGIRWIGDTNTGVKAYGDNVEMKVEDGYIRYKSSSVNNWTSIIAIEDLKGDQGDKGDTGAKICAAAFHCNDIDFTDTDGCTTTLANAKTTLTGPQGIAATVTVGTTTTGQPGTTACVTNVGTSEDAILNFTIPEGQPGNGDVNGPSCSTDGNIVLFDGATGKCIKDSGVSLACKQDTLTAGANIDITAAKVSAENYYIVTESNSCTTYTGTKGVAPYNTSYCYTNICINPDSGIKWKEGAIYTFDINSQMVATSACRNVRVKIGDGEYIPVMGTSSVIAGCSYFTKENIRQYQYSTKYQACGALHLFTDSNTTYTAMTTTEATTGTCTCGRVVPACVLKCAVEYFSPAVVDNVTSQSTTSALSANQGYVLKGLIDNLMAQGKFLSLWDSTTGLPISFPLVTPYTYNTGDYFMVETIDTGATPTNYRPNGSSYSGTASSTTESEEVAVGDYYVYDGSVWLLATNHGKSVSFANLTGDAMDNANLSGYLNTKAFYLPGTTGSSNLAIAQAAYEWQNGGKTAIVIYSNKPYTFLQGNAAGMSFKCLYPYEFTDNSTGKTDLYQDALTFSLSSGTVTSISAGAHYNLVTGLIKASYNYTTPYTPEYDGSPATKKYVDDHGVPTTGTTGYVLTKTAAGCCWAQPAAGGIQLAPNSEYDVCYHWYGRQSTFENDLTQYYTCCSNDTAFFTIDDE